LKLSLCIDAPEGDSDSNIFVPPDTIAGILTEELLAIYPAAQNYEFAEISLSFVSPEEIRNLNREYRNVDESTDVLSFPLMEDEPAGIPELPVLALGDIVICPEETARLHPELAPNEAIYLMIAHSFLHLLGYDHDTEEKQAEMWALQDRIAGRLAQWRE
jgi:probable rRNA maturation factor